jgi:hypothetical protein
MKSVSYWPMLLIVLTILSSCVNHPKVSRYFKRPRFKECIANGDGTMSCPGNRIEPSVNAVCIRPLDIVDLKQYYNDKEYRLYICLKYNKKCR